MNMSERKDFIETDQLSDALETEARALEPSDEVKEEFAEAAKLASGSQRLISALQEDHSESPRLSGGDVDAAWEQADAGEETVGGSAPTPDQAVVDELGEAVGLTYQDQEPIDTTEKVAERDRRRWELDPASSEGYEKRARHEGGDEGD
jgi:Family of unknown function (DUF6335)